MFILWSSKIYIERLRI